MARTGKGPATRARKKKLFKRAKGRTRGRNARFKIAKEVNIRALRYAKRDRRVKKRHMRNLWTIRISAACKELDFSYSRLISGLKLSRVELDRKVLAGLAVSDPETFKTIVNLAKEACAAPDRAAA